MSSSLENLKKITPIVADTGEIEEIKRYKPLDATTNPTLLFKATRLEEYQHLVKDALKYGKQFQNATLDEKVNHAMDKLAVNFGREITNIIKGRVSTELDARLSFNTKACVDKAREIIKLYEKEGVSKERILIKIACTWEGIRACEILEKEGIHCNMTLCFSLMQAVAAAEANATLVSPFVGRILDWYKNALNIKGYDNPADDPGVKSVTNIYNYFKKFGYKTTVMGASFRNVDEILELAGADLLTINPKLLKELNEMDKDVPAKLTVEGAKQSNIEKIKVDENSFRWAINEDAMATEKLAHGIRSFTADTRKLEEELREKLK